MFSFRTEEGSYVGETSLKTTGRDYLSDGFVFKRQGRSRKVLSHIFPPKLQLFIVLLSVISIQECT